MPNVLPPGVSISAADVAQVVVSSILIPLVLGLAIRTWWVAAADLITAPLSRIAQVMLNVVIILIVLKDLQTMLGLGITNLLIMAVFIILFIAIGHPFGGADLKDRITLGVTSGFRNGAVAMLAALQGFASAVPALVAMQVINLGLIIAYVSVVGKQLIHSDDSPKAVAA